MEVFEQFLSDYAGAMLVAILVAATTHKIVTSAIEDVWQDWLGHKAKPALFDSLVAVLVGASGGATGFFWHDDIRGLLVGFGATSLGSFLFAQLKRRLGGK